MKFSWVAPASFVSASIHRIYAGTNAIAVSRALQRIHFMVRYCESNLAAVSSHTPMAHAPLSTSPSHRYQPKLGQLPPPVSSTIATASLANAAIISVNATSVSPT